MCTGGRLLADFKAGTEVRPDLPPTLDKHLTTTVREQWVVWAYKLARPVGDLYVPLTHGARYPADAKAKCRLQSHAAPDPACTCGFHAVSSRAAAEGMLAGTRERGFDRGVVVLTVALSGRVLALEWFGPVVLWRAERQTVVRVDRPDPTAPTHWDIEMLEMLRSAGPSPVMLRRPGDPDGRPAVVAPAPPRDSGPIRLDLPVSAPVLQVCHDDAGWCAVSDTFEHMPASPILTSRPRLDRRRSAPLGGADWRAPRQSERQAV